MAVKMQNPISSPGNENHFHGEYMAINSIIEQIKITDPSDLSDEEYYVIEDIIIRSAITYFLRRETTRALRPVLTDIRSIWKELNLIAKEIRTHVS